VATSYRNQVTRLLASISEFRAGRMSIVDLQKWVWSTADSIASLEEDAFRRFLEEAEGDIELTLYWVNSDAQAARLEEIVARVEARLRDELVTATE
jgi:hypothetical protein